MITLREHGISVMLYCPFGFIDPPLALDERKHCDFYLGAGRPLPMKLDLLCPKSFLKEDLKPGLKGWEGLCLPLSH